jgi:hypothetical protein
MGRKMVSYTVSGMTCGGCAAKVQKVLSAHSDLATVTLEPPRAVIAGDISLAKLNAALAEIGGYRLGHVQASVTISPVKSLAVYYPLFLVLGMIGLTALAADSWMMGMMAGFYLVFGAFKLLDLPAFARSFAQYDVIARRFLPWAYAYPIIELALGFAFLFWYQMWWASLAALCLSIVTVIGVAQSVIEERPIQCACLGTVFNLPMSYVTIVENLGMILMAAWMLRM